MTTDLDDSIIQNQFYLIQLGNHYGGMIDAPLAKIRAYIASRLMQEDDIIASIKDLKAINKDVKRKSSKEFGKFITEIEKSIPVISREQTAFYKGAIEGAVEEPVTIERPKTAKVVAAALALSMPIGYKGSGVTLDQLVKAYSPRETQRITSRITAGFDQREPVSSIVTGINGTRVNHNRDGLLNVARNNAFSMTGTQMPQVSSVAMEQTNRLNSSAIIGYELTAVLDRGTTDTCLFWDGTRIIYSKTARRPKPPFHYSCRTTETPIMGQGYTVATNNLRKATGANGAQNISEKTTAHEWLKRQPASFQDDVLGKGKGQVFRNAGLTTAQFRQASVKQNGASLTLDQMSVKNKKINSYLKK